MKELEFVPPPHNILQRTRQVQSDPNKTSISHLTSIIYSWKKQKFCPQTLTTILKGDNPFCPGDSDSKKICLQCGRPGFNPWVGKIPRRRKRQPTPVFLPGESQGRRSLVGYSPWGQREWDMTERLTLSLPQSILQQPKTQRYFSKI